MDTIKSLHLADFRPSLTKTFANTTLDSEIRIGAYLALINSADVFLMDKLKTVLDTEPVNQGWHLIYILLMKLEKLVRGTLNAGVGH